MEKLEKNLELKEKHITHLEKALSMANNTITQLKDKRVSLTDEEKAALFAQHAAKMITPQTPIEVDVTFNEKGVESPEQAKKVEQEEEPENIFDEVDDL